MKIFFDLFFVISVSIFSCIKTLQFNLTFLPHSINYSYASFQDEVHITSKNPLVWVPKKIPILTNLRINDNEYDVILSNNYTLSWLVYSDCTSCHFSSNKLPVSTKKMEVDDLTINGSITMFSTLSFQFYSKVYLNLTNPAPQPEEEEEEEEEVEEEVEVEEEEEEKKKNEEEVDKEEVEEEEEKSDTKEYRLFGDYIKTEDDDSTNIPFKVYLLSTNSINTRLKFDGIITLNTEYKPIQVSQKSSFTTSTAEQDWNTDFINSVFNTKIQTHPFKSHAIVFNYALNKWEIGEPIPPEYHSCNSSYQTNTSQHIIHNTLWSCKLDSIILGEDLDIYLVKDIPNNQVIRFEPSSYYSIIHYNYLNYFLQEYFNSSDKCTALPISTGLDIYYIKCSKTRVNISTYSKPINFVLNHVSYQLRNLFDDVWYLNATLTSFDEERRNDNVYFNVLFSKTADEWVLGAGFFEDKIIGFDYDDNKVILYSKTNSVNFSKFSASENKGFVIILFGSTLLVIGAFLVMLIIVYRRKLVRVRMEIMEMLQG